MTRAHPRGRRLADLGEHAWIRGLLARLPPGGSGVLVGPGDDAAVLAPSGRPLVLTVDALVEGTHFRLGWESPAALGRRALRVNVSDVAAMGGVPIAALVAIEAPSALPVTVLDGLVRGFATDARRLGVAVVGGNMASGAHLAITVTLVGEVHGPLLRRSGARAGDLLYVTGALGAASAAVQALEAGRRVTRPAVPVRVAVAQRLARLASAAIDVSDGLVQDLGHVCRASVVAAELMAAQVPVARACERLLGPAALDAALGGGEDYELLVAIPAARRAALEAMRSALGCAIQCVGRVVVGRPAVRVLERDGRVRRVVRGGFDQFATPRAVGARRAGRRR